MLEMLINPKKAERHPWELFFIGLFYASLALFIGRWVFGRDIILSRYLGILIVTFTTMFATPFIYYTIRLEEKTITSKSEEMSLLKHHRRAIYSFLWLFLGFVIAFAFWYMVLPSSDSFRAQIETFCFINQPGNLKDCASQYGINGAATVTGAAASSNRFFLIFTNNIYVLIFTLAFSLIFGAGVIFVLAWNASVIAAAIGIFAKSNLRSLPLGVGRYMLHGLPEIASYFIVALAGGLVSVAVIRHEVGTDKFWEVLQDSLTLVIISVVVLLIAALLEVFVTPAIFSG